MSSLYELHIGNSADNAAQYDTIGASGAPDVGELLIVTKIFVDNLLRDVSH
jgi:hypothetical protein